MEKNFESGVTGFCSWKTEKSTTDIETQTQYISMKEMSIQGKTTLNKCEGGTEEIPHTTDMNYNDVVEFLRRAEIVIMKELTKCRKFNAQLNTAECLDSFQPSSFRPTVLYSYDIPPLEAELTLTSIELDSRGLKLAVAYCAASHKSWCVHQSSYILILSTDQITKNIQKTMNREQLRISVPSCITILAYNDNILFAGTFSGEILKINEKGDITERLNHHSSAIAAIIFFSNKTLIAGDKEGYVVKINEDSVETKLFVDLPITCGTILNNEKVLLGTDTGRILLFQNSSITKTFKCKIGQKVNSLSVHPNKRLFCACTAFEVILFDINQEESMKVLNFSLALWMWNGNLLCWAAEPIMYRVNEIGLFLSPMNELAGAVIQQVLKNSSDSIIRIDKDKHLLYEAKKDGTILIWNCIIYNDRIKKYI